MTDNQTIAEQCAQADDPYEAAVANCAYKSTPSAHRKVFIFADRSTLAFKVTYQVAETGVMAP